MRHFVRRKENHIPLASPASSAFRARRAQERCLRCRPSLHVPAAANSCQAVDMKSVRNFPWETVQIGACAGRAGGEPLNPFCRISHARWKRSFTSAASASWSALSSPFLRSIHFLPPSVGWPRNCFTLREVRAVRSFQGRGEKSNNKRGGWRF